MIITATNLSYCLSSMAALRKNQSLGDVYEDPSRARVGHLRRLRVVIQEQVSVRVATIISVMDLYSNYRVQEREVQHAPPWSFKYTSPTPFRTTSSTVRYDMRWSSAVPVVTHVTAREPFTATATRRTSGPGKPVRCATALGTALMREN